MKAERILKVRNFRAEHIGRTHLMGLLQRHNCRRHQLADELLTAFSHYGHLEVLTDAPAKRILDMRSQGFIAGQIRRRDFIPNLKAVFPDRPLLVLTHERDTVCIVASPENQKHILGGIDQLLKKPKLRISSQSRDIAEVYLSEVDRRGRRINSLPSLSDIEMDTSGGDGRTQAILVRLYEQGKR